MTCKYVLTFQSFCRYPILSDLLLELQVEATFLRAVQENIKEDHVILEINGLKYVLYMYTSILFLKHM